MYLYTIAPTVSLWDCGEFIACSHILGVPHPPGTPFFVILGRIFDILFPFKEVAKRINLLSTLSTAIAGGFLYLIILKVVERFRENRGKKLPLSVHLIAVFSAIGAGFSYSVWDTSVETEVYATSILILMMCLWLTLHWDEHRGERGDNNLLLMLVYLIFLSFGIHLLPLLLIPGILVFIMMSDMSMLKDPKFIAAAIVLVLIGVSTYLYLMVRAHANPAINEVNPTTWSKLMDVILRRQYGPMKMLPRKTQIKTNFALLPAFFEQIKVFFKYFSWQFFPYPRELTRSIFLNWSSVIGTYIYLLTGLWGMFVHFQKSRKTFWLFFILYILLSFGLVIYLNLKFSPSDPNPAHQDREVRERDYFWTPAFFLFMFYVSIGLYWIFDWVKKRNARYTWSVLVLAGLIGILPAVSNINSHVNRRGNWIAHDYAYNLLTSPKSYSILFTNGDNDTFPLWFLQEVKNFRKFEPKKKKGVRVACFSLMNSEWYLKQLKWAGVPMDFDSPFRGTQYESRYHLEKRIGKTDKNFEEWVIEHLYPVRGKDGRIIILSEITLRNIIVSSLGKKPTLNDILMPIDSFVSKYINDDFNPTINIYFAATVAEEHRRGFDDNLIMEGFAFRLIGKKERNMVDKRKSWDLIMNKFSYRSIDDPTVYKDRTTWRLLGNYASLCFALGRTMRKDVVTAEILARPEAYIHKLSEEEIEILRKSANVYKKGLIFSKDTRILTTLLIELRGIYTILGEVENLVEIIDNLLEKLDTKLIHLFKGQALFDKLRLGKYMNEHEKKELETASEREFEEVIKTAEEGVSAAYLGLLDLYFTVDNSEKLNSLVLDLLRQPEIYRDLFSYNLRYDTSKAIYLLEKWKEANPYDKEAASLLERLRDSYR
jgi:hypothetical protein